MYAEIYEAANSTTSPHSHSTSSNTTQPQPGHTYGRVTQTGSAKQVLGDQNGDGAHSVARNHHYQNVLASDSGTQAVGNINSDKALELFYQNANKHK